MAGMNAFKARPKAPAINPDLYQEDYAKNLAPVEQAPVLESEPVREEPPPVPVVREPATPAVIEKVAAAPSSVYVPPVQKAERTRQVGQGEFTRDPMVKRRRRPNLKSKPSYRWQIFLPLDLSENIEKVADKRGMIPNRALEMILRDGMKAYMKEIEDGKL